MPKFTDAQLAEAVFGPSKLSINDAAKRFGVSRETVSRRLSKLKKQAVAAEVFTPAVAEQIAQNHVDVQAQMLRLLEVGNKLLDACDAYLTDPDEPDRYYVGPRASDIKVVYLESVEAGVDKQGKPKFRFVQRTKTLQEMLFKIEGKFMFERWEAKHTDIRSLLNDTTAEIRGAMQTLVVLARAFTDAKHMQDLEDAIMRELESADPDAAERIARAVSRATMGVSPVRAGLPVPAGIAAGAAGG